MNFKLTLTLVIVLLLIASLFLLVRNERPAEKKSPSATTALFEPRLGGIKTISYLRDGKEQVAFARDGENWKLTFPTKAAANFKITNAADMLQGLAYKEKFEPAETGFKTAESTGTKAPRNIVKFTDDAGKEYTLALGKSTVGGVFATLNGGKTIYLLGSNPLDQLDKDPQEFRDTNIKEVPSENITKLVVKHADQTVSLARSTSGTQENWLIDAPISTRANATVVTDMLNQMRSITASGFPDMTKDMPATGLNPPVVSITVEYLEKPARSAPPAAAPATASQPAMQKFTLELGYFTDLTSKNDVYASLAGSNEVFTVSAEFFKKLNRQLADIRDPAVTPAMVGESTDITIAGPGKPPLTVARKDGKWTLAAAGGAIPAGEMEIGEVLNDIRNLRAIKYVDNAGDLKSIGLDPPQTRIEMTIPGQAQHEVILIGKSETDTGGGKVTPMMRQGEPTVFLVPEADAQKIMPTPLFLRDKALERLNANNIHGIVMTGSAAAGGGVDLAREGASWKVKSAGKSERADDGKITSLLAEFTPLTAVIFLADQPETPSAKPDVTVTLTLIEPEPAATAPATNPATAPATEPASAPPGFTMINSATEPATTLPNLLPAVSGPPPGKTITRVLSLYKTTKGTQTTWKAIWDGPAPQWPFEPTPALLDAVTKATYAAPVPATKPAPAPEK